MPIIPTIGRKSLKMRSLIAFVYVVLVLGACTTVYPFMIMLGSSVTSLNDFQQYRVIPRYLYNEEALRVKYLDDKYRPEQFGVFKLRYDIEEPVEVVVEDGTLMRRYGQFVEVTSLLKDYDLESAESQARVGDWLDFIDELPGVYKDTFFHYRIYLGEAQVGFQEFLKEKYGSVEAMQDALKEVVATFVEIDPPFEAYARHSWFPADDQKMRDWLEYRETLQPHMFNVTMVRELWEADLQDVYPEIEGLNSAWGAEYEYFWQIPFADTKPAGRAGEDWEAFIRKKVPLRYAYLEVAEAGAAYVEFIKRRYRDVKSYNLNCGDDAASFEDAELASRPPVGSIGYQTWQDFYQLAAPIESIRIDGPDARYSTFLRSRHANAESLNAAYGTAFASFDDVEPPWRLTDYQDLKTRQRDIRWTFLTRNYVYVIRRVFLQGRPIINTFVLVVLTVGSAVTINPLAAYALARYRLSYSAHVLIFMLATMAFPAEVAMIPNFLLIKELGLLNTFAALVLPGLASGYSVFLLRGFFDSLPQELYEAASIDGASEFKMFWVITMPLSLPILSVIALFSFSRAYGSFLWAFTVCQDSKMWTLMVFLQQFQAGMKSHPYLVMASLVIAAIPTIVVFLSAQKVLMRGIVVPTMK